MEEESLMNKHHAIQLYDYHVWANNKFFGRLNELPQEIYDRELQSIFSSIAETLVHIYTADTLWLGVMHEKSINEAFIAQTQEKKRIRVLRK
jgi:uncharacterized damage-inducible protein DinB